MVTDPTTLHLHIVSQSYIVMVTCAESSNTCHTFYHSNSGIKYSFSMFSTFYSEPHEFSRTLPLYFIIELIQFIAC